MQQQFDPPQRKKEEDKSAQELKADEKVEQINNDTEQDLNQAAAATNVDETIVNSEAPSQPTDEPLNVSVATVQEDVPEAPIDVIPDPAAHQVVNGENDESKIF